MALSTLQCQASTASSELESLMLALIYTVSKGHLFWAHCSLAGHEAKCRRWWAMTNGLSDCVLEQIPRMWQGTVESLCRLFFPKGAGGNFSYNTRVTSEQFIRICKAANPQ